MNFEHFSLTMLKLKYLAAIHVQGRLLGGHIAWAVGKIDPKGVVLLLIFRKNFGKVIFKKNY